MKIKHMIPAIAILAFISGCSSSSDTDLIKNGVLEFNKTLTVGEAFDNWGECQQKQWKEFSSDNGQRVVQFNCVARNAAPFMQKVKSILTNESKYDHFGLSEVTANFQWTINKDDSFQLNYVGTIWKWSDGKAKEVKGEVGQMLNSVYNNESTFDLSSLEDTESLVAVKTARAYADMMYVLYDSAK
ncbi:hypothetical protein [Marinobacter gelidimuriae]|uniref:hypothetical protein n=1 Tax=Marinobacter gelidimuriae TaxID=2739064 RepID=UPI000379A5EA|nr:hypothetical protein [Marinobacter gelidimuriae]